MHQTLNSLYVSVNKWQATIAMKEKYSIETSSLRNLFIKSGCFKLSFASITSSSSDRYYVLKHSWQRSQKNRVISFLRKGFENHRLEFKCHCMNWDFKQRHYYTYLCILQFGKNYLQVISFIVKLIFSWIESSIQWNIISKYYLLVETLRLSSVDNNHFASSSTNQRPKDSRRQQETSLRMM